jgi:hypothetical protein
VRRRGPGRIVEESQQQQRVGGSMLDEVALRQCQAQRAAAHERLPQLGKRRDVREYRLAEIGNGGPKVGPVQEHSGAHARMVGGQFGAEIQAFFPVRPARGQFVAGREVTAPGQTAGRHGDAHLLGLVLGEEGSGQSNGAVHQSAVHAVIGGIKEAPAAGGGIDRARCLQAQGRGSGWVHERTDVDNRRMAHANVSLREVCLTPNARAAATI